MADPLHQALARMPKVDRLLGDARLATLPLRRSIVRRAVQLELERVREQLRTHVAEGRTPTPPDDASLLARVLDRLARWSSPPRPVINATGVLLHTNLGRTPLGASASAALQAIVHSYCDLELELETGKRGSRLARLAPLLAALCNAEDALVVNNGAAALLLACTALAPAGGLALSLGQLVEIGDGFRVADMAAAAGASLWTLGSTNRTHLDDYRKAIAGELPGMTRGVAAILWVHRSNFVQQGFVGEPSPAELGELARAAGIPLIADLGSGAPAGDESIAALLEQGASVVIGSGDKLFGGPQAGLLLGASEPIARMRRHPLARALRLDKLSLAALHATAIAHAQAEPSVDDLPLERMRSASLASLRERGEALCDALAWPRAWLRASEATIGGGSLPGETLPSLALVLPERLAAALRRGAPAVMGRVHAGELWLDLRTVLDDAALREALAGLGLKG